MEGVQGPALLQRREGTDTVKRWLHRIAADSSGLAFEDWDPCEDDLDPKAQHAFMIVNSSEVRGAAILGRGAKAELQEIPPKALQGVPAVASGSHVSSRLRSTSAAVQAPSPDLGPSTYALRPDFDNQWRGHCE